MNRRELITLLGSAAAAPISSRIAEAQQQGKVPQIGLLSPFSRSDTTRWYHAFRLGLRDLGWVEEQNIKVEYRYGEGQNDRLPDLVADLVRLGVAIIVASVATDARIARRATTTIPIVVVFAGDPVGSGLVDSLARPGGNITGLSQITPELSGKRLELLKEIVPNLSRVAVLWNPKGASSPLIWQESKVAAQKLGIQLLSLEVRTANELDKVFDDAIKGRARGIALTSDPLFAANLKRIADLAARSRLPSIGYLREFVDAGGLVAYGPDRSDMYRRAAGYVDKILKGAQPADLPVEQPTKFELVINLKTAKALSLTVPPTLLARADEAIE